MVSSVAIAVSEIFHRRRRLGHSAIFLLLAANATWPSYSANLLLYGELIHRKFTSQWTHPRLPYFAVIQHLVGQIPPSFLFLGVIGAVLIALRSRHSIYFVGNPSGDVPRSVVDWIARKLVSRISPTWATKLSLALRISVALFLTVGFLALFREPIDLENAAAAGGHFQPHVSWYPNRGSQRVIPVLAFGAIYLLAALTYLIRSVPLGLTVLWFSASLYGMSRYYFIDHHLMYVLAPFSILLSYWLSVASNEIRDIWANRRPMLRIVIPVVLALLLCDSLVNIINVQATYRTLDKAERDLVDALPEGKVRAVTNSVLVLDAQFIASEANAPSGYVSISRPNRRDGALSAGRQVMFHPAVNYGTPHTAVGNPPTSTIERLQDLVRQYGKDEKIYLIFLRRSQWPFWPLDPRVPATQQLKLVKKTELKWKVKNYYVDPLRYFLPEFFAPRPVPPDYYRELFPIPAGLFRNRIVNGFDIYELVSLEEVAAPVSTPSTHP